MSASLIATKVMMSSKSNVMSRKRGLGVWQGTEKGTNKRISKIMIVD